VGPKNDDPTSRRESDPESLNHRIDQATLLAKENLYEYSEDDIQHIWEIIKKPLISANWLFETSTDGHPPIDRLFEIAADFNGATEMMIEGEIAPSTLCATYALMTTYHAKTEEGQVSKCLMCVDAWRALAFIPRAEHLHRKLTKRINKKMGGEKTFHHMEGVTKGRQEFEKKVEIIKPEFDRLTEGLKYKEELDEVTNLVVEKLSNIDDSFEAIIDSSTVKAAIIQFRRERRERLFQTHGVCIQDSRLCWPQKQPDKRDQKLENFSGEIRCFDKRNRQKLKDWARSRAEIKRLYESIRNFW
jgi:hypothetical protein